MTGMSLFLSDLSILSLSLERTIVYALWYATLLWLPVRGAAALIDHRNGRHQQLDVRHQMATANESYCIGMNILPPL